MVEMALGESDRKTRTIGIALFETVFRQKAGKDRQYSYIIEKLMTGQYILSDYIEGGMSF